MIKKVQELVKRLKQWYELKGKPEHIRQAIMDIRKLKKNKK